MWPRGASAKAAVDAVPGVGRDRRARLQVLLSVAQDPLQARAWASVPRRRRRSTDGRSARLGAILVGQPRRSTGRGGHPIGTRGRDRSEARAKRVASRERKVAAGIDELDRWLRDLMRRGLDSTRSEGYRFWDAMGARLVDAQAGGLGRSVRGLGSAANSGDAWPHLLLEGAGTSALAVRGVSPVGPTARGPAGRRPLFGRLERKGG